MPYLAVTPADRDELAALAERRWEALAGARPELASAVELQRGLLKLVLEVAQAIDAKPLPRLSLPPRYLAAKLVRGVPALSCEPIPLPTLLLSSYLLRFCSALAAGGAGEVATHISLALETGKLDAGSLLTASFTRDQNAVRVGATHMDLAPDLTWLIGELAVGPVAHALQRALFSAAPDGPLAAALAGWNQGYCPACGSWAALAEIVDGHRLLRCAFCAATWERTLYACVYCDADGDQFVTAAPDPAQHDRRIEICHACGGYLKTVDAERLSPFPLLAIADMETMDLDIAAMEHHYGRPPMKEFSAASRING